MNKTPLKGEQIFTLTGFLSPDECDAFIQLSEQHGYDRATLAGDLYAPNSRNNDRVILDDPALADDLFQRARPFLPPRVEGWTLAGFNERLRFYRYGAGQRFTPHRDGSYFRPDALQQSLLTFMVYLNTCSAGGSTNFFASMADAFEGEVGLRVAAEAGKALVFEHERWHEGSAVEAGIKYVLRTDVMYGYGTVG